MKATVIVSTSIRDLRDAVRAARKGGLVAGAGEPRDIDGDKSRFAMTVMVLGEISDFREYIELVWKRSIRLA